MPRPCAKTPRPRPDFAKQMTEWVVTDNSPWQCDFHWHVTGGCRQLLWEVAGHFVGIKGKASGVCVGRLCSLMAPRVLPHPPPVPQVWDYLQGEFPSSTDALVQSVNTRFQKLGIRRSHAFAHI